MPSSKFWSIANTLGLTAVITVNALANALPINGLNTGELSDRYPNLFVPAGLTFSIWGIIYLLLLSFVIYGLSQAFKKPSSPVPFLEKIGPLFLVNCLANISWILAWHYLYINLSLGIMLVLLLSLIGIYLKLEIGNQPASPAILTRVQIAFSVYLGWISIATIANSTAVLVNAGWTGFGISPVVWTVILLTVGMVLALRMLFKFQDLFFALVVVWAFIGILIKRNQIAEPGTTAIMIAAGLAILVLLIGIVLRWKAYRQLFDKV